MIHDERSNLAEDQTVVNAAKKVRLGISLALLLPWLPFALLSGMAFDGGDTLHARFFLLSVWTYPVAVIIVPPRNARPGLVLLRMHELNRVFCCDSY